MQKKILYNQKYNEEKWQWIEWNCDRYVWKAGLEGRNPLKGVL